ncbi:MAG: hypothetical protein U0359_38935 [Byssovorax sp.]
MNAKNGLWVAMAIMAIIGACNYTEGDCYPVGQSDGPAAADVGVGVGSGAGGYGSGDAPKSGGTGANACNMGDLSDDPTSSGSGAPPDEGTEAGTYIRCLGQGPKECSARCFAAGAYCVEYMTHPEDPSLGSGTLKQCMDNWLSFTCTYCYPNGDVCTYICAKFGCGFGRCTNTGGKGCE